MKESRKIKLTSKIKSIGPKLRWFLFTEMQDFKLTQDYIDFICPDVPKTQVSSIEKLESLVRQSIIREFSPEIQGSRSFDLLVDAVMHKIQKDSLAQDK